MGTRVRAEGQEAEGAVKKKDKRIEREIERVFGQAEAVGIDWYPGKRWLQVIALRNSKERVSINLNAPSKGAAKLAVIAALESMPSYCSEESHD